MRVFGLDVEEHEVEVKRRMGVFLEEAPLFRQVRVRDVVKIFAPAAEKSTPLGLRTPRT